MDVALQAIGEAAVLCEQVRGERDASYAIEKSDSSPVTVADFGSQALICRRLVETFPDDAIVAEEDASDRITPGKVWVRRQRAGDSGLDRPGKWNRGRPVLDHRSDRRDQGIPEKRPVRNCPRLDRRGPRGCRRPRVSRAGQREKQHVSGRSGRGGLVRVAGPDDEIRSR